MTIKPLFDKDEIKKVEAEEQTQSGIIITNAAKEKPDMAEVLAVGPGGTPEGKDLKMEVKVGDIVLCAKYSGTDVKVDGQEVTIVRQADILAIIEK